MNKVERIKELVSQLNEARKAYYAQDREVISNLEYDKLYDELELLEKETGITLANSPTQEVGYEAVDELPKEQHESPMLSLDKTKDVEELRAFIRNHKTLLSWKMDGLTVVLTYENGSLLKAVTRGNGVIGEVVTNNARMFQNIPLQIPYQGRLILRGEAIISYSDFEKINDEIEAVDAKYKNPRNLCSGSVRQLNNQITRERKVRFYAFALVQADDINFHNSHLEQMIWLKEQGFEVVENRVVTSENLDDAVAYFSKQISENDFPSDGLVALYDDIAYGNSLGTTAKFPRNAYAFKWEDELKQTVLREIEWSPSRTGLINPVAIFDPVELEGTTVSRASVHNISIMKELKLGIGDTIEVYKANMIIPQIARNLTGSGLTCIAEICPACQQPTRISKVSDVETLYCTNPKCPAKQMKAFTLFASRDALNIEGMSEATLEKLMAHGFIHEFADIFRLDRYADEIRALDGFGDKSWSKLWSSIQSARKTTLPRLIYGLGIPNIGSANARMISKYFHNSLDEIRAADMAAMNDIDGIGEVIARSCTEFFHDEENNSRIDHLLEYLELETVVNTQEQRLADLVFVITGSVVQFENRSAMKAYIEELGGKVTGSVTKKTSYLINNDATSNSSKNKKAKELGVPIISEQDFLKMTE